MKIFILAAILISTNSFAMIGKVPSYWTSSDVEKSFTQSTEDSDLEKAYQNILEAKSSLFESAENAKPTRWYLQSIQTELAIESEGTLGVMGAGGEAALELVWIKKNESKAIVPKFNEEVADEAEEIVINTEMTEESLKKEIAPVVDLAMASGHIKKRQRLFRNLFNEALKFQNTARELETAPAMGPWYAYKYQLELYVSVEGDIGVVEVGNSLRLRLEWWRLRKEEKAFHTPLIREELSPNARFVTAIASDVAAADRIPFENGFRFNCMKVGVGTTVEGNLFLVKGKASAVGSIFFKRDYQEVPSFGSVALMSALDSYNFSGNGKVQEVPRYSFRKGIEKAAAITHFFARHAKTKKPGQFELNVIETEFELFGNGGVGLVTVEGAAVLTLFVTRNVTI